MGSEGKSVTKWAANEMRRGEDTDTSQGQIHINYEANTSHTRRASASHNNNVAKTIIIQMTTILLAIFYIQMTILGKID